MNMRLVVQPGDGLAPLLRGIEKARRSVEIVIFRFDRAELERALEDAVKRGVFVHALIAHANRSGEKSLRRLETRLLARGVTVARTADDLARYHGKMMIVDREELYVLAFNFTYRDIERSRSFALITRHRPLVQEAVRLFEADIKRQPYTPGPGGLLVSPVNARKHLASFLKGARRELLIYDQKVRDRAMIRLLEERARAGVDVRILGTLPRGARLAARKLSRLRLHTRTIVRDRRHVFLGSQSLRELELDGRREIGVIFQDAKVTGALLRVFEEDWESADAAKAGPAEERPAGPAAKEAAKKAAKAIAKDLPPVAQVVEQALKQAAGKTAGIALDHAEVEDTVKDAVKAAVKQAVRGMVAEAVNGNHKEPGAPK